MTTSPEVEHLDVLVVGAGLSGLGAGRYLKVEHPARSFAILEARGASGGTWDLFRYPGVRSDSDLYTFGYEFEPWRDKESIASASKILDYLRATASKHGVDQHVRYYHRVVSADWSNDDARWMVEIERTDTGQRSHLTTGWIFCAGGYYRYDEGYTPEFIGRESYRGQIVHPQHWPADLDYTGKKVVVIGSGATAITLIPAMAEEVEQITMLQRTPTYVLPVPKEDPLAAPFIKVLGEKRGYAAIRRKNIEQQRLVYRLCQRFPRAARRLIRTVNSKQLPDGFPVDEHFNPPYDPWDQRVCAVPDGDLFRTIRQGKASVVTDRIATFTETGLLLESGRQLEADIIITATGLNLQVFGGMDLAVDGRPVVPSETVVHRGTMLSGVPNFAMAIGYTNSSWTLKVGLLCEYFCQLLTHMDQHGHDTVYAVADPDMPTQPLLDFGAGYVQRSLAELPRQGPAAPWLMSKEFLEDRKLIRRGEIADDHLTFSGPAARGAGPNRVQTQGAPR
ncbi:monooxygenase, flavin-binding family [Aeromicrobium marinum DSM 15272]|uniref:Monooxygenase, flavin-binding family n=1 Tax=Aeromicrobium marinum DSM 15272 TaxID=585531 RepID=E2SDA4_9ACTN|nr:NAD(P)/FAD-dependent oxidoreductase [Aeromicrobium marinum]EFQ82481.1 monooxygenase, flavin-binding family [Aeromicrobium marinum DSM 15272]